MTEQRRSRITDIILDHWNKIKGDRKFPHEDSLDMDYLECIWDNCFFIQVRDISLKHDYNYTYFGKNITRAYGQDLNGVSVTNFVSPHADHLSNMYDLVINTRSIVIEESEFKNINGDTVKYRQCLVPLGPTDDKVHSILGGMTFKVFK
jgi:hypothetical protein